MSASGLPPVGDIALEWNIVSLRARLRPLFSRVEDAALSEESDSKGGLILVRGDALVALAGLLDELLFLLLLPTEKNTACPKLKE